MTLHEAKSKLETGDSVWVQYENSFGIVQEFDRTTLTKSSGIDVLIESDGVVCSCAIGQIHFEKPE